MRFKKSFAIIPLLILIVNFGLLEAWHHEFPTIPLSLTAPAKVATRPTLSHVEPATLGSEPPAYALLNNLIESVAIPKGWEKITTDSSPIVPSLYPRCNANIQSPAIARSIALRKNKAGILIEASAYPAGVAPEVFSEISSIVKSCSGFWITNDIKLGIESIAVNDNGALEGSGSQGRTIWVRWGDVIGMVSIRGGGNLYTADNILTDWVSQWSTIITNQICLDSQDTVSDFARSPLSTHYKGITKVEHVTLTQAQQAQAISEGDTLVAQSQASLNASIPSPNPNGLASALPTIVPTIELPKVQSASLLPYGASVIPILPPNEPTAVDPQAPTFPKQPSGKTVLGSFQDQNGPGCGWAFTGETPPGAISISQVNTNLSNLVAAQNQLINDEAQYQLAKWNYAVSYQQYLNAVKLWNIWVTQANTAIIDALWLAYDTNVVKYNANENAYNQTNATWLGCMNSQNTGTNATATPSPSLTPSPTPSGTPISPTNSCGAQPIAPLKPIEPIYPRP